MVWCDNISKMFSLFNWALNAKSGGKDVYLLNPFTIQWMPEGAEISNQSQLLIFSCEWKRYSMLIGDWCWANSFTLDCISDLWHQFCWHESCPIINLYTTYRNVIAALNKKILHIIDWVHGFTGSFPKWFNNSNERRLVIHSRTTLIKSLLFNVGNMQNCPVLAIGINHHLTFESMFILILSEIDN